MRLGLRILDAAHMPRQVRLDALKLIAEAAEDCAAALDAMDADAARAAAAQDPWLLHPTDDGAAGHGPPAW